MIDLLIDKRTRQPIVAKPAGSVWGYREIDGPNLCVVQLDDPPTELAERLAAGHVAANPFAEYERREIVPGGLIRLVMVRQSTVKLRADDVWSGAIVQAADMEMEVARP